MERFALDLSNHLGKKAHLYMLTWGGSNKFLPIILPIFFIRASWILLTKKVDVIHVQDGVQAPVGWLLSVVFRKPYIIVAHGLDVTYQKFMYQAVIVPFIRRANHVIAISQATMQQAIDRGVDVAKIEVITLGTSDDYNGKPLYDKDELSKQLNMELANRKVLLTTGRLVKRKGVAWFVANVLPQLVGANPSILYLVVGVGSEKDAIELAISANNMTKHAMLLGRVSDRVRTALYQSCDVFVMPNIVVPGDMEGFGIVGQEAATAARPVVASGIEGIRDALTHTKSAMLVSANDIEGFEAQITDFLNDASKADQFGEQARDYILTKFGWDVIADKYIKAYQALLTRR